MRTNKSITLYHYDGESERFSRVYFPRASVHKAVLAAVSEGGLVMDSLVKIRIPIAGKAAGTAGLNSGTAASDSTTDTFCNDGADLVEVDVGDYVFIGKSEFSKPDRACCHKVLGFSHNLRGANPHVRIEAK